MWRRYLLNGTDIYQKGPNAACVVTTNIGSWDDGTGVHGPNVSCAHNITAFYDYTTCQHYNLTLLLHSHQAYTPLAPSLNLPSTITLPQIALLKKMGRKTHRLFHQAANASCRTAVKMSINAQNVVCVANNIKDAAHHNWWDIFTGWSPETTHFLNIVMHPIVVLLVALFFLAIVTLVLW